jgi:hypothetical protein
MIKKILIISLIFFGINQCGYSPIFSNNQSANLNIKITEITGDEYINNYIKRKLNRYTDTENKEIKVKINSKYNKSVITKDKQGNTSSSELKLTINFVTEQNGEIDSKNFSYTQNINMNSLNNKIEEDRYEKDMKEMLADSIINQAIQRLSYN